MKPYQLILACVERGPTLAATMTEFENRLKAAQNDTKQYLGFGDGSILSVPNMEWNITHAFKEIIGEVATGPKLPDAIEFHTATQQIAFRMDRTGVSIASKMVDVSSIYNGDEVHRTGHYIFDQPFLIIVRSRGHADPTFVMWVDNAELLQKK